jgi:hypothetical protein
VHSRCEQTLCTYVRHPAVMHAVSIHLRHAHTTASVSGIRTTASLISQHAVV